MDNLENSLETAEQETENNEPSNLKSLADLLADESPAEESATSETDDPGKAAEKPTKAKPKSLKALAESLKLEDKDLYAIEIPMANGETRTLGQLKDAVAQQDDFTMRELEFEESRQQKEGELIRAQQELRELLQQLPRNALKPETLDAIRQKHEAKLTVERQRTLEVIPEWKDEGKRTEELTGIVEHLSSYGFPKEYISTIYDHRTLKYIRDNYIREKRIRKALEQVKAAPPSKTATSRSNGKAPNKPSKAPNLNSRNPLADFLA